MAEQDPARFGFLATLLARHGAVLPADADRVTRWQAAYHRIRGLAAPAFFNKGEVDGFRAVVLQGMIGDRQVCKMVGVRDDGMVVAAEVGYSFDAVRRVFDPAATEGGTNEGLWPHLGDPRDALALARWMAEPLRPGGRHARAIADEGTGGRWAGAVDMSAWREIVPDSSAAGFLGITYGASGVGRFREKLADSVANSLWRGGEPPGSVGHQAFGDSMPGSLFFATAAAVAAEEKRTARLLSAVLARACDPEALLGLRRVQRGVGMVEYNALLGVREPLPHATWHRHDPSWSRSKVVEPEVARRRRQAVDLHPWCAPLWLGMGKTASDEPGAGSTSPWGRGLLRRIDDGLPFEAQMAGHMGGTEALIRRLRGVTWQKAGVDFVVRAHHYLGEMALMAPEHVPTTRPGFRALRATEDAVASYTRCFDNSEDGGERKAFRQKLMAGMGGRMEKALSWEGAADILGAADVAADLHKRALVPMVYQACLGQGLDAQDAVDATMHLAPPALAFLDTRARREAVAKGMPFLLGEDPGLRRASEVTQGWHRALPRLDRDLRDPAVVNGRVWSAFFGRHDLGKGWEAEEATSAGTLRVIGTEEGHCAAGFDRKAASGHAIIAEIKLHGQRVSTVEVGTESPHPKEWSLVQNRGKYNEDPGKAALAAGTALLSVLRRSPPDAWARHKEVLAQEGRAWMARPQRVEDVLAEQIGFHAGDRTRTDRAFEAMAPFMDKRFAKMGPDRFRAEVVAPFVEKALARPETARAIAQDPWF